MWLLIIIWTCRVAGLNPVFRGNAAHQNPEHKNTRVRSVNIGGAEWPRHSGRKYSQLIGPMETGSSERDLNDRAWRLGHH